MRKVILFLFIMFSGLCFAQQNMTDSVYADTTCTYTHTYHIKKNCICISTSDTAKVVCVKRTELKNYRACGCCCSSSAYSATSTQTKTRTETYNGHTVYTGPRGGKYYYNSKGNKVYIKK